MAVPGLSLHPSCLVSLWTSPSLSPECYYPGPVLGPSGSHPGHSYTHPRVPLGRTLPRLPSQLCGSQEPHPLCTPFCTPKFLDLVSPSLYYDSVVGHFGFVFPSPIPEHPNLSRSRTLPGLFPLSPPRLVHFSPTHGFSAGPMPSSTWSQGEPQSTRALRTCH